MIHQSLDRMFAERLTPLDILPPGDIRERLANLAIKGVPSSIHGETEKLLRNLRNSLLEQDCSSAKVVVFGGGTGLSNIVGGDSRAAGWVDKPFSGLKEYFPHTRAVVCITDNGGSTGELLKDLPIIALGDIRHVLLSSIRCDNLRNLYRLSEKDATQVAGEIAGIFNHRFFGRITRDSQEIREIRQRLESLPREMAAHLLRLFDNLFTDYRFNRVLTRPHCLGNLLIASAVYLELPPEAGHESLMSDPGKLRQGLFSALVTLESVLGSPERGVMPCTSTPAQLRVIYANGVEIPGEHKLADARRGFPVQRVEVDYFDTVHVYDEVLEDIRGADIIVLAPGSLYSSIIPIFKVPGLADAVRSNHHALKVLISNLWVQAGETDLAMADPGRKFYVSDMIRAYENNIPGGIEGLFDEVICVSLKDIPASVLQRYAVEGKVPIYLDRETLSGQQYVPIECEVHSGSALQERGVIQHDPDAIGTVIKTLYGIRPYLVDLPEVRKRQGERAEGPEGSSGIGDKDHGKTGGWVTNAPLPCRRYNLLQEWLHSIPIRLAGETGETDEFRERLAEILWDHPVIPVEHLDLVDGISCLPPSAWLRDQKWDNVFSFYDPDDKFIKIRGDQLARPEKLEVGFLIALGESLLGNYASEKRMADVFEGNGKLGQVYHLYLRNSEETNSYFSRENLVRYLHLARMCATSDKNHFTRLVNKGEGFTPPGVLMGLMYAWYVDNRFATHIEYKMSVMRMKKTDLIPEQMRMLNRRKEMVRFFREVVFRQ